MNVGEIVDVKTFWKNENALSIQHSFHQLDVVNNYILKFFNVEICRVPKYLKIYDALRRKNERILIYFVESQVYLPFFFLLYGDFNFLSAYFHFSHNLLPSPS